jgi:hypothetical protein
MRTPENKGDFEDVTLMLKGSTWDYRIGRPDNSDRLTKNQKTMLRALEDADSSGAGISVDDWNAKAREAGLGERRRADLIDLRNALTDKKKVYTFNDLWFVTKTNP